MNATARRLPMLRAECEQGPRPCPHVTCRHHLRVDLPDDDEDDGHTCSLDLADLGGMQLAEIGRILGVGRERVRQIEALALRHVTINIVRAGITRADAQGLGRDVGYTEDEVMDLGEAMSDAAREKSRARCAARRQRRREERDSAEADQ